MGEHDQSKFEWGPFILAPRRGRGGGRGGRSNGDGGLMMTRRHLGEEGVEDVVQATVGVQDNFAVQDR